MTPVPSTFRVGFPIDTRDEPPQFVVVRRMPLDFARGYSRSWLGSNQPAPADFAERCGAGRVTAKAPRHGVDRALGLHFYYCGGSEMLDWTGDSDSAACALVWEQEVFDQHAPIVLISGGLRLPSISFHDCGLLRPHDSSDRNALRRSLLNKWSAACMPGGGVCALVLREEDAEELRSALSSEFPLGLSRPHCENLAVDTLRNAAQRAPHDMPLLVSAASDDVPLLARSLGISEAPFIPTALLERLRGTGRIQQRETYGVSGENLPTAWADSPLNPSDRGSSVLTVNSADVSEDVATVVADGEPPAVPNYCLRILTKPRPFEFYLIEKEKTSVGSGPNDDIYLDHTDLGSGHVTIAYRSGRFFAVVGSGPSTVRLRRPDPGDQHTFLLAKTIRANQAERLEPLDELDVGTARLRFQRSPYDVPTALDLPSRPASRASVVERPLPPVNTVASSPVLRTPPPPPSREPEPTSELIPKRLRAHSSLESRQGSQVQPYAPRSPNAGEPRPPQSHSQAPRATHSPQLLRPSTSTQPGSGLVAGAVVILLVAFAVLFVVKLTATVSRTSDAPSTRPQNSGDELLSQLGTLARDMRAGSTVAAKTIITGGEQIVSTRASAPLTSRILLVLAETHARDGHKELARKALSAADATKLPANLQSYSGYVNCLVKRSAVLGKRLRWDSSVFRPGFSSIDDFKNALAVACLRVSVIDYSATGKGSDRAYTGVGEKFRAILQRQGIQVVRVRSAKDVGYRGCWSPNSIYLGPLGPELKDPAYLSLAKATRAINPLAGTENPIERRNTFRADMAALGSERSHGANAVVVLGDRRNCSK